MSSASIFGRYTPYRTPIHKLDARNKIFMTILFIVMIFFSFKTWSTTLIMTGIYLLITIILMIIARVNFLDLFKSLFGMWLLIIFIFVIYIFMPVSQTIKDNGTIAFSIGNYHIYWYSFYQSGYIILRIITMLAVMMVLTSTTKPTDLTYSFEWYMAPLKVVHFPVAEIAMTLSIAIRFIPTLLEETERIMKAQASRGLDLNHGGLIKRLKAITALIVPLFASAFERSAELADAMEARGYDPRAKRTKYKKLRFGWLDLLFLILILAMFGGVITMFVFDNNGYPIDILKFFFGIETII